MAINFNARHLEAVTAALRDAERRQDRVDLNLALRE
jgi:hypothetical protein